MCRDGTNDEGGSGAWGAGEGERYWVRRAVYWRGARGRAGVCEGKG